jgi:hypothetical protein
VNELVILTIHLTKVSKDIIEVLAIDILPPFSNRRNNHVQEIKTSVVGKMADCNLVDLIVGFNSRLKQDYVSKTRERKNNANKDRSLDVMRALPLIVMLSRWGVCILPNRLVVQSCRINVWIG